MPSVASMADGDFLAPVACQSNTNVSSTQTEWEISALLSENGAAFTTAPSMSRSGSSFPENVIHVFSLIAEIKKPDLIMAFVECNLQVTSVLKKTPFSIPCVF